MDSRVTTRDARRDGTGDARPGTLLGGRISRFSGLDPALRGLVPLGAPALSCLGTPLPIVSAARTPDPRGGYVEQALAGRGVWPAHAAAVADVLDPHARTPTGRGRLPTWAGRASGYPADDRYLPELLGRAPARRGAHAVVRQVFAAYRCDVLGETAKGQDVPLRRGGRELLAALGAWPWVFGGNGGKLPNRWPWASLQGLDDELARWLDAVQPDRAYLWTQAALARPGWAA